VRAEIGGRNVTVSVNVNKLSLCHKGSGGFSVATLPDVCKTPSPGGPVPVPYPNIASERDLAKGTTTVKADGGHMCAKYGSEFSMSMGDEPGTVGGVKSSTFKKEASWITYSFDVKLEGKGACRLTDKMFHNHQNTASMAGKVHAPVPEAAILALLCEIFCKVLEEAKKSKKKPFPYSKRAEELAKGKYAQQMAKYGLKAEARTIVRLAAGKAKQVVAWGRQLLARKEVVARVGRQVAKQAAKTGAKVAAKAGAGAAAGSVVPGAGTAAGATVGTAISIASNALDVVELVKAAGPLAQEAAKAWAATSSVGIRPDVVLLGKNGAVKGMYDYKFDYKNGTSDRYHKGQDKIMKQGTGKQPKTINKKTCNNCKPGK
jgi:hypothetical protein